jgi:hypothetical protein
MRTSHTEVENAGEKVKPGVIRGETMARNAAHLRQPSRHAA